MVGTRDRIESLVIQMQTAFLDIPHLRLTITDAMKQFGESRRMCEAVLVALVEAKVLTQTDGLYVRRFPQGAASGMSQRVTTRRPRAVRHVA